MTRTDGNYAEAADAIAADLRALVATPEITLADYRRKAAAAAAKASWKNFIPFYQEAYCIALDNRDARTMK